MKRWRGPVRSLVTTSRPCWIGCASAPASAPASALCSCSPTRGERAAPSSFEHYRGRADSHPDRVPFAEGRVTHGEHGDLEALALHYVDARRAVVLPLHDPGGRAAFDHELEGLGAQTEGHGAARRHAQRHLAEGGA